MIAFRRATSHGGTWGTSMGYDETSAVSRERTRTERLTEGLTVALASVLSLGLLAGPAFVLGTTAWHLITEPGATAFGRFAAPLVLLLLVALPLVLSRMMFRSGRRKGREPLTAAVPAALTLLGATVVSFAAVCLIALSAD
ncbi:hypothetical protein ACIP2X_10545 [Streptomyces sp. NPDC089424]|uniref:hypothetical protein n=1 Tax=Streptomyces sp. NPDC089424 TaxID=3365917 RepID=UPI0038127E18